MAALVNLHDLFLNLLKDMYYAEKKVLKSLPKMEKAVGRESVLAMAFAKHYDETEGQIARLEKVFEMIGERPRAKTCAAMDGLIEESMEIMENADNKAVLEAGLLADSQAVEHYEIARYGTLITWANLLGYEKAAKLLEDTLSEEKKTDTILTDIAEREINERALAAEKNAEGKGRRRAMAERVGASRRGQSAGKRQGGAGRRQSSMSKKRGRTSAAAARRVGNAKGGARRGRPPATSTSKRSKSMGSANRGRSSAKRAVGAKSAGGRRRRRSSMSAKG